MEAIFTKERVIQARDDLAVRQELVSQTQALLAMLWMAAASEKHEEGEDEPEGVVCTRCGELTMYSSAELLPCADFAKMCLSNKCIEAAILEMAKTLVPDETPAAPHPQTDIV